MCWQRDGGAAPESREAMREQEKKRVMAANRQAHVETDARALGEKVLPCSIAGKLCDGIRRQIEIDFPAQIRQSQNARRRIEEKSNGQDGQHPHTSR